MLQKACPVSADFRKDLPACFQIKFILFSNGIKIPSCWPVIFGKADAALDHETDYNSALLVISNGYLPLLVFTGMLPMFFNLEKVAQALDNASSGLAPAHRLARVAEYFSSGVVFTTSFGIEDQMITHLISIEKLPFKIVTLDTGRLFPETYEVWQRTEEKYGLRIHASHPDSDALSALVVDQGINGFYYSPQMRAACCAVRKTAPLKRALKGASAWITGLRRDQSQVRGNLGFILHDKDRELLKINPLYDLSRKDISAFVRTHDIPVNVLHAAGFLSIGCAPCTRAIRPGEDERAGRWWWETDSARECGLHVGTENGNSDTATPQHRTMPT